MALWFPDQTNFRLHKKILYRLVLLPVFIYMVLSFNALTSDLITLHTESFTDILDVEYSLWKTTFSRDVLIQVIHSVYLWFTTYLLITTLKEIGLPLGNSRL
jgi:hypothetical protein